MIEAALQLYSLDVSGNGQAVALNQDGSLNSPANPARLGSIVALWGTGAGITTPLGEDGALAPLGPLEALPRPIGGARLSLLADEGGAGNGEILYLGAAPGQVNGLIQVNIRLPDSNNSPNTTRLSPSIFVGRSGEVSNVVWIAVRP